ncbi:conserved hypothetical protein (DUF159) [Formosa agariphila KMM 3901]|uniref:Abasic site processing protein n=1 Tax=Formosa agariphila (strain DSM 15362 / KCTC 12365 / LMG 23005 / KMM 3901 / M-2Alg 35-1) TaxID=1347342 RepID=T2KNV0_FORAG|nr:SOS response-associated peptidase family protein [Formosa agariphila]CDF80410.1 conserved hypothetical protein (DUF159) [Formosa agariphila KMM 3901]
MFYKISNIANRVSIENTLAATFKFPHIYKPKQMIDGTSESVLPILTSEDRNQLKFAIWGMLPDHFEGDWKPYQYEHNTLNIRKETIIKHLEFKRNSNLKRCLIPITGFIDFSNTEGEVTPFLVSHSENNPFCVAGIYNQLEDGFFTFSIITTKDRKEKSNSISKYQPAILSQNYHQDWLNPELDTLHALEFLNKPHDYHLNRYPIATHVLLSNENEAQDEELGLEDAM